MTVLPYLSVPLAFVRQPTKRRSLTAAYEGHLRSQPVGRKRGRGFLFIKEERGASITDENMP